MQQTDKSIHARLTAETKQAYEELCKQAVFGVEYMSNPTINEKVRVVLKGNGMVQADMSVTVTERGGEKKKLPLTQELSRDQLVI